jgi:hypothetical protein
MADPADHLREAGHAITLRQQHRVGVETLVNAGYS